MELILVRHGLPNHQSHSFSSLSIFQQLIFDYDKAELSELGQQSIAQTAQYLPRAPIISSDLPRARHTAEILAKILEVPVNFDSLYREVKVSNLTIPRLNKWQGPTLLWKILRLTSWIFGIGEFEEGPRQVWSRVEKAVQNLLALLEKERKIILVSHGWFITLIALKLRLNRMILKGPILPGVDFGSATVYQLRKN